LIPVPTHKLSDASFLVFVVAVIYLLGILSPWDRFYAEGKPKTVRESLSRLYHVFLWPLAWSVSLIEKIFSTSRRMILGSYALFADTFLPESDSSIDASSTIFEPSYRHNVAPELPPPPSWWQRLWQRISVALVLL
jgi:hypothetical protein